jgi:hypothetical protein
MGVMGVRRWSLAAVVSLCALGGCLVSVPGALALTPPVVEEEAVLDVAGTSATLQAKINPEGSETTYRFEYGTGEGYVSSTPMPDGLVGAAVGGTTVIQHVQGLSAATAYHFRVVAMAVASGEVVYGNDRGFTTQTVGSEMTLPDERQWQLVSPTEKNGALIMPINEDSVIESSADGSAFTYLATAPLGSGQQGNLVFGTQVLSKDTDHGWESVDITPPHGEPTGLPAGHGQEYRFFSSDLSTGLVEPFDEAPLSAEGLSGSLFFRETDGSYGALLTSTNVQPGADLSGPGVGSAVAFVGSTPDLRHVVLRSSVSLTKTATYPEGLYEWSGGQLTLISVLPNGEQTTANLAFGNSSGQDARHAISEDGSRVVWTTGNEGEALYVTGLTSGPRTVQLNVVQPGAEGGEGGGEFQSANAEGSVAYFTDGQRLTVGATAGGRRAPDLYKCDIEEHEGELTCSLTDLTVDANPNESAAVQRVLGASDDGAYVYFVANGVLGTGENARGERAISEGDNLYLIHDTGSGTPAPVFVARLSPEDANDWSESLSHMTARVAPDGRYLAFMSDRSLTSYDNADADSGSPDEEVYLYDALANSLVCASCNPTGARPTGMFDSGEAPRPLLDQPNLWSGGRWLAANIPGWTPYELESSRYQSRYLSDDGRLFFNSNDALVPQDTNGKADVYEYESGGTGDCRRSSVTFSERSNGCVGLISSGSSGEESAFLDSSASGDDVFFLSAARLAPEDFDTSIDVYDAHVCTGALPCVSVPVEPPPCSTGDSCKPSPTPQPGIFGAPSSSTFSGIGNISPAVSKPAVTGRSLTVQKLSRALTACKKKPKKGRHACETTARKRYRAKAARGQRSPHVSVSRRGA